MQGAQLVGQPAYEAFAVVPRAYTDDLIWGVQTAHKEGWQQTAALAATLRNLSRIEQLQAVYRLVDERINYTPDADGLEVAQTAALAWHRRSGDCKSYAVTIASLLKHLGIKANFRFAQYDKDLANVQHVYVVADSGSDTYIPMDPCMRQFGVERRPWIQTKDFVAA